MALISNSNPLVAIDDGHGMATPGKRTPVFPAGHPYAGTFMHENDFNRVVGKYLEQELKRCGIRTLQVAPTDADDSLATRVKRANDAKADFYVSIHANANTGKWGEWGGIETLVYNNAISKQIGSVIHSYLKGGTKLRDRGIKDGSWLYVVKYTNMPSVLVECGFMDNLYEAELLKSDAYRRECARELAQGICDVFGKKYIEATKPVPVAPSRPIQTPSGKLYKVQIGAFSVKANADKLSRELQAKGIKNFVMKEGSLFKVQTGAFGVKANADAYSAQVNKLGYKTYIAS